MTWETPCDPFSDQEGSSWWRPRAPRTSTWLLTHSFPLIPNVFDGFGSRVFIARRNEPKRDTSLKMHFSVRMGDLLLARGRFRFETIYDRGRLVWEGSDAFVNYCINGGHTIYSEGGRLYCAVPTIWRIEVQKLRWQTGQ